MTSHPDRRWLYLATIILPALALAACESPPPTAAMERARTAIDGAQLDGAGQLAPDALQSAQSKLASAQTAVGRKDMTQAKYLAEESEMEAILASQTAQAQNAVNANAELQKVQSTGSSQPPATSKRNRQAPQ